MAPHYFSEKQESEFKIYKMRISNLRGFTFDVFTAPGIFSWKKLDNGTKTLAKFMKIEKGDSVLDLGCGIGILGIVAAKMGADVMMSDINKRAVKIAKMNAKSLKINAKTINSDLFSKIDGNFDVILTNPPVSAGIDLCFDIITKSKNHLNTRGSLQLVARHKIAGSRFRDKMIEVFGNCDVLGKSGGFWIYISENKNT